MFLKLKGSLVADFILVTGESEKLLYSEPDDHPLTFTLQPMETMSLHQLFEVSRKVARSMISYSVKDSDLNNYEIKDNLERYDLGYLERIEEATLKLSQNKAIQLLPKMWQTPFNEAHIRIVYND